MLLFLASSKVELRVVEVFEAFTHSDSSAQPHHDQATETERMRWRDPQNVLQVECAQLGGEEEHQNAEHVEPALQAGSWSPIVRDPVVWTELAENTLQLARERGRVPKASPVVRLHGKVLARLHAKIDTDSVTHQKIKNPLLKRIVY
jgi:hypothetical protein